jgi:tRNA(Ile)-lysidine synthase
LTSADAIETAVARAIADCRGRILVAYSGGLDSTVLLHAAAAVVTDRTRLIALHVDHGLQAAAADWPRHCRAVSQRLAIDCIVRSVQVAGIGSIEHAARRARYAVFAEMVATGDVLLLAHQRDDQAETVLWRLLRGGGRQALAGMPVRRVVGGGELRRPLLAFPRQAIERWARARHLDWIDDASNAELRFTRNFLRHRVLSTLRQQWPDVERRLVDAAARAAEDAELLQTLLDARLEVAGASRHSLPLAVVDHTSMAAALVRRWLHNAGLPGVPERVVREIVRQAGAAPQRSPAVDVAPGWCVRRHAERLQLTGELAPPPEPRAWRLDEEMRWQYGVLRASRGPGMNAAVDVVSVRARRGGERLRLPNGRGSRSVKRLLREADVPRWLRTHYPLLYVDGHLAAVPGVAVDAAFVDASERAWQLDWRVAGGVDR